MKRSGIQRDVLALYRLCLRAAMKKPVDARASFRRYARDEFRVHLDVNKKDFATIEHLLRIGHRKLNTYSQPGVKNISW